MKTIDDYKKMPKSALADRWFWLHNIPTTFLGEVVWLDFGEFEIEVAESDVEYRANEFLRLLENDLIKQPFKGILLEQI